MEKSNKGRPTGREMQTRIFYTSGDADTFAKQMGNRVIGMAYGTDVVKVTVRPERFADITPKPMPRFESPTTATQFNMNGSISFEDGVYATK